jgi:hypothetical protein
LTLKDFDVLLDRLKLSIGTVTIERRGVFICEQCCLIPNRSGIAGFVSMAENTGDSVFAALDF